MRKRFSGKRIAALTMAVTMALSVINLPVNASTVQTTGEETEASVYQDEDVSTASETSTDEEADTVLKESITEEELATEEELPEKETATAGGTVYDSLTAAFAGCAFNKESGWDEHMTGGSGTEFNTTDVGFTGVPKQGAKVTADILVKGNTAPSYSGEIKFKGVMRLGSDWNFVQSQSYPALKAESFKLVEGTQNWYKAVAEWEFGSKVDAWYGDYSGNNDFKEVVTEELKAITIGCAGANTDFTGDIYVTNVQFTDGEEPQELEKQEPSLIADFAAGIDGWAGEAGWDYSHGQAGLEDKTAKAEAEWDAATQSLKMTVDYSADSASGWSEAKVKGTFTPVSVKNYNMVTFTLRYPSSMEKVRTKLFMSDETGAVEILNAEGSFRTKTVKDLGNGWSTVTIRGEFTPKDVEAANLTIGIVGPYADLTNVYIDDVQLGQVDASEDYVEITEQVKSPGDVADLSGMANTVKLVDGKATNETKVLAAYLAGLQESGQVLFGHQNSTFRSVRDNGVTSDVKDITGSEAGLFGIDTLALAGVETSQTTRQGALDASVAASKKAYNGGSLISLSCHMPNFTNSKIKATGDSRYPYDFTKCDFSESKDLTPCADYILEGGKYNPQFNAYLDIIADYAMALQEDGIPVLFRPFHENSGGWFWWGTSTSVESYQAMWRYMVNYLGEKGVHNFLYVYSPNGPISSEEEYLERYPGDAYVDVLGFDYYDDYADANVYTGDNFFDALADSCDIVAGLAKAKRKIPAIAETGIRITGAGKDSLMVTGNPTKDKDWYNKVVNTASEHDIPYFLLWANFDSNNFFVPYKYSDTLGQEMINDFISSYNNENSIFGNGTHFYTTGESGNAGAAASKADKVSLSGYSEEITGYMITPKNYAVIKKACELKALVKNAKKVEFKIQTKEGGGAVMISAVKNGNIYTAALTTQILTKLGQTSTGIVTLIADGQELGLAKFINFNKDADVLPQNVFDNFEYYYGNNGLLQSKYGSANSAANCSSSMTLDGTNKAEGSYGGAFNYKLTYKGSEVWTGGLGRVFDTGKTDFSKYNAISMWVKPDGNGQKLVIQLNDSYEAYLTDFVKGNKAQYVTIPLTKFVKKGGSDTVDATNITNFKIWCNSVPANYTGTKDADGNYTVESVICFDDIKAVKISDEDLARTDANGLIISNAPLKDLLAGNTEPSKPQEPTTEPSTAEAPVVKQKPNIEATKATTTSITLKWKKNNKAAGYYVYAYNSSKKKWVKVKDTKKTSAKITKISGKKLKAGTTYKFKVTAYTKSGKKKKTISGSTLKLTYATAPKKVSFTSVKKKSSGKAALKWKKVSGASGYEIYMRTGSKGKYKLVKTIKKGKTVSYTKAKLKKKTKYYFKVRAYKTVGGKKVYGSYSKVKTIKLK